MKRMKIWISMVLLMLAGSVLAEDGHSEAARGFFEKLGGRNLEEDYRALEGWVFEEGLEDGVRRERVEEGVWVLTGYSRFSDRTEREVWVEQFLERLEKEAGGRWWAWLAAGEVLEEVDGSGAMVDGVFVRGRVREVNSRDRDAARARQCFLKAMGMAAESEDRAEAELRLAGCLDGEVVAGDLLWWLADRYQYDAGKAVAKAALVRDEECHAALDFLEEIGPAGMFVESGRFVAGREVLVEFVSRELSEQRFELWELDVEKYVAEDQERRFQNWDSRRWRAEQEDFERYGRFFKKVATWRAPLAKKGNHMQSRNRVKVPVERAGAYLVVAMVGDGCVVLPVKVAGTVLLTADLRDGKGNGSDQFGDDGDDDGADLFLIDAITGEPVEGATAVGVGSGGEVVSDHTGYLLGMDGRDGILVRREGMPVELLEVRTG